ncbi:MAG: hypothetical protein IPJ65_28250 [Archangiaceae bacterium]|nr:hypothetical protein [Archangiaceae bacterium]
MKRAGLVLVAVVACASRVSAGVATERLTKARAAAAEVQYQAALRLAAQAMEAGDASVEEVWQLHVLEAELWAATGDAAAATRAFAAALALHPDYRPAADVSPRILEPYERARADFKGPLAASTAQRRVDDARVSLTVRVVHDALGLVQIVRLGSVAAQRSSTDRDAYSGEVACAGSCTLNVALVDEWGNTLHGEVVTLEVGVAAAPAQAVAPEVAARAPFYRRPGLYLAIAAVASLAAGAYFGAHAFSEQQRLVALNADRGSGFYADALGLEASRKTSYAIMWVGLGVGVLAGVGAGLLW